MPKSKAWWVCAAAQTVFWSVAVWSWEFPHWWCFPMVVAWNICAYTCGEIAERERIERHVEPKMRDQR